jgi:hypothetical protein
MSDYGRRISWRARVLNLVAALLGRWPVILLAAFLLSPVGPHLYWSGEYRKVFGNRIYTACTYLGSRGAVPLDFRHFNDKCPTIMWLDSREFKQ